MSNPLEISLSWSYTLHGRIRFMAMCCMVAYDSAWSWPCAVWCLRIPGGSSANVIKGLANLSPPSGSLTAKFLGMVGRDATGQQYKQGLEQQGVVPLLLVSTP